MSLTPGFRNASSGCWLPGLRNQPGPPFGSAKPGDPELGACVVRVRLPGGLGHGRSQRKAECPQRRATPGSQRWLRVARKHQPMPRTPTFDPGESALTLSARAHPGGTGWSPPERGVGARWRGRGLTTQPDTGLPGPPSRWGTTSAAFLGAWARDAPAARRPRPRPRPPQLPSGQSRGDSRFI